MDFNKLKDVLINLGFEYSLVQDNLEKHNTFNDVHYFKLNDLEFLKYGQNMYVFQPFLTIGSYTGQEWFNGDFAFQSQIPYKYYSKENPMMLNKEDFKGYTIFDFNGDYVRVPFLLNPDGSKIDEIAKFSTFIIQKIVELQSKQKNAKFKFKIKHKNFNKDTFVEEEEKRVNTRLHNDFVDKIVDDEDFVVKMAEESLKNIMKL